MTTLLCPGTGVSCRPLMASTLSAGAQKWPGANIVTVKDGGKFLLRFQDRTRWVQNLKV